MKNKRTHYVLENLDEVYLLFNNPEAGRRVRDALYQAQMAGDKWCQVIIKKTKLLRDPVIKEVITKSVLQEGEKDFVLIGDFLEPRR